MPNKKAVIETARGTIELELFADEVQRGVVAQNEIKQQNSNLRVAASIPARKGAASERWT